jgi:energy-coupling factor transport system permease protein
MNGQLFKSSSVNTYLWLDPRTKLLLMLIISTIMISGDINGTSIYVRLVLATIPFILLLSEKKNKWSLTLCCFFVLAWLGETFLVFRTTGLINIVIVMMCGLISRFIPCIVMGCYVMVTTRVSEFIAAMERMHVSQKIIIPLSVMFRFFPTVAEESHAINDAMRMRNVGIRNFSNNPTALFEYRLVPLLMSVVKIGDELSASALTRGLGSPERRTNICKIGFGIWDVIFSFIVIAALAFYIIF